MIGFIDAFYYSHSYNHISSQSMTVVDSLHSDYECLLFCRDWFGSDLRIGLNY
jgi:hypothetical protein